MIQPKNISATVLVKQNTKAINNHPIHLDTYFCSGL